MDMRYYYYSKAYPEQAFGCTLVYSNQMDFIRWARKHGASKKNGADFYFDSITPVDTKTAKDIPGFLADGNTTWKDALDHIKKHFNIAL